MVLGWRVVESEDIVEGEKSGKRVLAPKVITLPTSEFWGIPGIWIAPKDLIGARPSFSKRPNNLARPQGIPLVNDGMDYSLAHHPPTD